MKGEKNRPTDSFPIGGSHGVALFQNASEDSPIGVRHAAQIECHVKKGDHWETKKLAFSRWACLPIAVRLVQAWIAGEDHERDIRSARREERKRSEASLDHHDPEMFGFLRRLENNPGALELVMTALRDPGTNGEAK